MYRCRGRIELAEQGWIALDQIQDHLDQNIDTFFLQVIPDTGKRARAVALAVREVIRRQSGGHHMLAKAKILERRAGTFAVNVLAVSPQFRPVVFRARNLRQHAPRLDGKNLNLAVTMIGRAPREHFRARKLT